MTDINSIESLRGTPAFIEMTSKMHQHVTNFKEAAAKFAEDAQDYITDSSILVRLEELRSKAQAAEDILFSIEHHFDNVITLRYNAFLTVGTRDPEFSDDYYDVYNTFTRFLSENH
jgi:hypothetical protein